MGHGEALAGSYTRVVQTMAYLNHAGTSWPKALEVRAAVERVFTGDPGTWAEDFERDQAEVARLLGVAPDRLLLTPGCTSALALALADLPWSPGDRVLTSSFEHHALMRPLRALERRGVEVVAIPARGDDPFDLDAFADELARGARAVAISHASNVTGALLPVGAILADARERGAWTLVDAAQTAGWLPLPLEADLVAFAGHKGPGAPWGVGGLVVGSEVPMASAGAVCTLGGEPPPRATPGYCDAGSVDRAALAGLAAGLRRMADDAPLDRARAHIARLEAASGELERLGPPPAARMPTLALRVPDPEPIRVRLRDAGVVASVGLQCAPRAHETLGTAPSGALRFSAGPTTTAADIDRAIAALTR
tara:strand:- start:1683 stop:2780 length:1098 start_codon:yes stop_codon:yes gene_type:complete